MGGLVERTLALFPKHPFAMRTRYDLMALLTYAIEPQVLRRLVPRPLELDTVDGRAFVTVVCADMEDMRPAPLPRCLGITYDQVVYRVPVRYRGERGLAFLGSDAQNVPMVIAGALFSMFKVRCSSTRVMDAGDRVAVDVVGRRPGSDFHAFLKVDPAGAAIPATSAFGSREEARAFLVDRFVAFVPGDRGRPMRRVRVARGAWQVTLPALIDVRSDLLDGSLAFPPGAARLDNALVTRDIEYEWFAAEEETPAGGWRPAGAWHRAPGRRNPVPCGDVHAHDLVGVRGGRFAGRDRRPDPPPA